MAGPLSTPAPGLAYVAPTAAPWVTDFLNAAAFARDEPAAADVRLALGVLTTRWALTGRRLGVRDLPAFHRAFGADRLRHHGRIEHDGLLEGAARLLGDWFPDAWHDARRRADGVAYPTVRARRQRERGERLALAAVGELTPPRRPAADRHWSTYDPVALPDPEAALALLRDPSRWPDMASIAGRFTPLRPGGLRAQTFEIELLAGLVPRAPLVLRCYVTCTAVHLRGRPLRAAIAALPGQAIPEDAEPLAFVALTTHAGHVLGRAISHLVAWRDDDGAWIRDVGCWDPLAPHLAVAYVAGGRTAQHAFWSPEPAEASMLAQLARVAARAPG